MTTEQIYNYILRTWNAFCNQIINALTKGTYGEIIRIHGIPETNPLGFDIHLIVSREFTKERTLKMKITCIYSWYLGRGYWEQDISDINPNSLTNIDSFTSFVQQKLRRFQTQIVHEVYRTIVVCRNRRRALPQNVETELRESIKKYNERSST